MLPLVEPPPVLPGFVADVVEVLPPGLLVEAGGEETGGEETGGEEPGKHWEYPRNIRVVIYG